MTATPNPLLERSTLDLQFPPFDRIEDEHYLPAFEQGMAEHAAEVRAIADNSEPATFDNTVDALERSGELLERVSLVFFNLVGSTTNDALRDVRAAVAPRLAAHSDAIYLDPALFGRIDDLYDRRDDLGLDAESAWLLERQHLAFVRAGARLDDAERERLKELNAELASLSASFQEKLFADTNASTVTVADASELDGLSPDAVAAAASTAEARGFPGQYAISLNLPSQQEALSALTDRSLRERLLTASITRGHRGDDNDTTGVVLRIASLRAERAALLGFPSHADYVIADQTAGSAEAANTLLRRLAPVAAANAKAEVGELRELASRSDGVTDFAAWDWAFYAERLRRNRFSVDATALRPYFELGRVLVDGVFHAATKLYGITFAERHDLPVYHPDVRVFEVRDTDGSVLGIFLGDYFARESKRGGAWMNNFVNQSGLRGTRPVIVNVLNVPRPPDGDPALLTFDEVITAFHEFGHALHGFFSDVRFPKFSGTKVPRDFVEFPSQVNEMWATWPEVLSNYARHHETGEPLPNELVERLLEAQRYGQGFATSEYLAAALLDQAWHRLDANTSVDDVAGFEQQALSEAGLGLAEVPPRYRSTYFAHVFSGGYDAGYYSYLWSEVLDADTVEWFKDNGGLRRENGDHFRRELLSKGGSLDPMEAFRAFRGSDPELAPLLVRKGLAGA